ncbi:hypothetical protein [Mesobacillus subterraneus]|uniref:hypothetical protein n=1 Tax=Mesobacillus subterraneus TaxID=285983 RepID=UPI001CFF2769|nr:hypothetical protein [Mesobacillus subterraneus]
MTNVAEKVKQINNLNDLFEVLFTTIENDSLEVDQILSQHLTAYGVFESEEKALSYLHELDEHLNQIDKDFFSLREAKRNGYSRSQWLMKELEHSFENVPDRKNEIIEAMKKGLSGSNNSLFYSLFHENEVISNQLNDYNFEGLNKSAVIKDFLKDIQDNTVLHTLLLSQQENKGENNETNGNKTLQDFFTQGLEGSSDRLVKKVTTSGLLIAKKKAWIPSLEGKTDDELALLADKAVNMVKVAYKVAKGEINPMDAVDHLIDKTTAAVCTTVKRTCELGGAKIGKAVGTYIGSLLGPAGSIVVGQIGENLGTLAGNQVGHFISSGIEKISTKTKEIVRDTYETVKSKASQAWSKVKSWFN